ncbi:MAG: pseudouridine-5'-phosphate glycosidase [Chloroflexi bacterium]|nr:pseudouridine-5'-phosphate glycosidase [Chloroflexota bacterium]
MAVSSRLTPYMVLTPEIQHARKMGLPIVALESTLITHGLPRPQNLELALQLEQEVRDQRALPATVGVLEGKIHIGLSGAELETLASAPQPRKISRRDFAVALANKENGGTTVAGTLFAAHAAGIRVFATGGIGGVHRDAPFDVSADLPELGRTPMIVVCAGAKAILDLPATLEYLETVGVPVIGYGTDEFPAFYSRSSGLPVTARLDNPDDVARMAQAQWELGLQGAILVAQPLPQEEALPDDQAEEAITQALADAHTRGILGAEMTPFLLARVAEITGGASLQANLTLLRNNARLAAQIAVELARPQSKTI